MHEAQRAGAEALFAVYGCFAEDSVVPPAALDLLAPLVCGRAKAAPASKLKVRRWLALLLKASLLSKAGGDEGAGGGVSAHDLVRDVMIARAAASEDGGIVALQRSVLDLFLTAYESEAGADEAVAHFLIQSIRHHAQHARQPGVVALHADPLLMRALCASGNLVCVSAVSGIGLEAMQKEIGVCEASGAWWEAAQLCFAVATYLGQRGGSELKRVWAALKQLPAESPASMTLEQQTLSQLFFISEGGYAFGTAEHKELQRRQAELVEILGANAAAVAAADSGAAGAADAAKASYEVLFGEGMNKFGMALQQCGLLGYVPPTEEVLTTSFATWAECFGCWKQARGVAPDRKAYDFASNILTLLATKHTSRQHRLPEYKREEYVGQGGALLRENIERYDFAAFHIFHKTNNTNMDVRSWAGQSLAATCRPMPWECSLIDH